MRLGMTVIAVLTSLALVDASASAAYAARKNGGGKSSSTPTGNDVSYPQCGKRLPSGQAFGIVGVNDGLANTTNPCLATEIAWAQASSGTTSQPRASLYVNTADPGNLGVTDWPTNNVDPVTGATIPDPYGTCTTGTDGTGKDDQACAWQYGWNMADLDAQARGVSDPGSYRWWLDVETANSWESSAKNNRADLEGMVDYLQGNGAAFQGIGATVGIYSTPTQWGQITGTGTETVTSASPLYYLPDWIPGARTLSQAEKNCGSNPLTGKGTVTVTQWTTAQADSDFSCS